MYQVNEVDDMITRVVEVFGREQSPYSVRGQCRPWPGGAWRTIWKRKGVTGDAQGKEGVVPGPGPGLAPTPLCPSPDQCPLD